MVDDNELFALGLRACLAGQVALEIVDADDERLDVAVVSPEAARARRFSCPLVVCGEPGGISGTGNLGCVPATGNLILATLPRSTLTAPQLVGTVHAAAAGLRVTPAEEATRPRMEGRSLEVLRLLASGAGTREIAERLGYSDRTIKSVIHEVQLSLGARNRVQAVAEGIRQGIIHQRV